MRSQMNYNTHSPSHFPSIPLDFNAFSFIFNVRTYPYPLTPIHPYTYTNTPHMHYFVCIRRLIRSIHSVSNNCIPYRLNNILILFIISFPFFFCKITLFLFCVFACQIRHLRLFMDILYIYT